MKRSTKGSLLRLSTLMVFLLTTWTLIYWVRIQFFGWETNWFWILMAAVYGFFCGLLWPTSRKWERFFK